MNTRHSVIDFGFATVTRVAAFTVLLVLLAIIFSLLLGSLPALVNFGTEFLWTEAWDPVQEEFGAAGPVYGTLVTSAIAMIVAVPVSFGIALFITELCPRVLRRTLGIAIELLAAIPSIIYGMWGLFVFAPWFSANIQPWLIEHVGGIPMIGALFEGAPLGIGMFTAGLVLSIMVIPFIAAVMRDVFEVVPPVLKESSYAMGATTWEVMRSIVLPYTKA
ncbi:MAG: phosphate ABC transporter permease subunit PstC, partial [Ectothiorhodospira sp.]